MANRWEPLPRQLSLPQRRARLPQRLLRRHPNPPPPAQARPSARPAKTGRNYYIWASAGLGLILLCILSGVAVWSFYPSLFGGTSTPPVLAVATPVSPVNPPATSPPITATAPVISVTVPPLTQTALAPEATAIPLTTSTPLSAAPTPPPLPSAPPAPTTPSPASTSAASILFRDDFETNIKPEWVIQADNKSVVNGQLALDGASKISLNPGKTDWTDYTVSFATTAQTNLTDLSLWVRVQDEQNYLKMECARQTEDSAQLDCRWLRMAAGQLIPVPATNFALPQVGQIAVEIKGDVYRIIGPELTFTDLDQTVKFGGVTLEAQATPLTLDYFEVTSPSQ